VVSVVFMPLNVLAGIGGMSEFINDDTKYSLAYFLQFFYRGLGHRWLADLCHFEVT
jgi:hypothetical protein